MTIELPGIQTNKVVFFGPANAPKAVRWWAENGLIRYEDSRTSAYDVMSVRTFLERLRAVNDMLSNGNTKEATQMIHRDELERHMRFVEDGLELARIAKEQGEPSNADARKQAKASRPTSVIVPRAIDAM